MTQVNLFCNLSLINKWQTESDRERERARELKRKRNKQREPLSICNLNWWTANSRDCVNRLLHNEINFNVNELMNEWLCDTLTFYSLMICFYFFAQSFKPLIVYWLWWRLLRYSWNECINVLSYPISVFKTVVNCLIFPVWCVIFSVNSLPFLESTKKF